MAQSSTTSSLITPTPLPPLPESDCLGQAQWTTLLALLDTFVPSIVNQDVKAGKDSKDDGRLHVSSDEYVATTQSIITNLPNGCLPENVTSYLEEKASNIPAMRDTFRRILNLYIPSEARRGLALALTALNTRIGSLVLTRSTTPIHLQPPKVREEIVQGWSKSYIPAIRKLFRSLALLTTRTWVSLSQRLPPIIAFPQVPAQGKRTHGFDFEFLQFQQGDEPSVLETDVLIVGSGCGGGVCAKKLSEAGHSVLVADKAYHFPSHHFPMDGGDADIHLMESGGAMLSDDDSIAIFAGSTWGGGGTVNWSASLQTQAFVRKEWADGGLPFFTSAEFQRSLDRVCLRMGVSAKHIEHNFGNRALLEGSRRLGYGTAEVPQNTAGQSHYCGYCTYGCAESVKQGPANSFLPDAARAGAKFLEGFYAEKVLFDDTSSPRTAKGVTGVWTSRDRWIKRNVTVKAKKVIISCGTLQSPLLLLRSGVRNSHVGRNLHLHPSTTVTAVYDEETRPWEGGILTSVLHEFENTDGHGHGVKLETMTMVPLWIANTLPWKSGIDLKHRASKFHHMIGIVVIARDRDPGRVYPDPDDGRPRFQYTPSRFDLSNICEGITAAVKIAYITGAREINWPHPDAPSFRREGILEDSVSLENGINDPKFQQWLQNARQKGFTPPNPCISGSAHQMGSCRMSNNPRRGVVDPSGKVWGTQSLYVSDASVFPSASGVNPMVTNMAISDWVSQRIANELSDEKLQVKARL